MVRRAKDGKRRAIRDGSDVIGGRLRDGYRHVKSGGKTMLKPVISEAEIVREVFQRWNRGESALNFAVDLNERKITRPTSKRWSVKTLNAILVNETYAGHWYHGRTRSRYVNKPRSKTSRDKRVRVEVPVIAELDDLEAEDRLLPDRTIKRRAALKSSPY